MNLSKAFSQNAHEALSSDSSDSSDARQQNERDSEPTPTTALTNKTTKKHKASKPGDVFSVVSYISLEGTSQYIDPSNAHPTLASHPLHPRRLQKPTDPKKAGIFSSVVNLSNTVVGAGVLGLPYAISRSGYVLSPILFVIFGLLSGLGLHLMLP